MDCCHPPQLDASASHDRYLRQRRVLWIALAINLAMFFVEIVSGWYAGSTALLADALDFLADSATYGLTLYVLAKSMRWKASAALIKGAGMGIFGLWVVFVAVRRALHPELPHGDIMLGVSALALVANVSAAALLFWCRGDDVNMRSVWLCSRNDAVANLAVMAAAGGVIATVTAWPDLVVGGVIASLEISAGWSVIREALGELRTASVSPG